MLILFGYSATGADNVKALTIDVRRSDKLRLSQISSEVIKIPLKIGSDIREHEICDVVLLKNYLYVLEGGEKERNLLPRMLQFDLSGNFIRQIGAVDPKTHAPLVITKIFCDSENEILLLMCLDGLRAFDPDGSFKYYKKEIPSISYLFNNRFFIQSLYLEDKQLKYSFFSMDPDGKGINKFAVPAKHPALQKNTSSSKFVDFSVKNHQLFVSFGYDLKIYQVNGSSLKPVYSFTFENCDLSSLNIPPAPPQIVFGVYVQYGYWISNSSYGRNLFMYNTRTNQSYNIRLRSENGILTSGIEDDINHTGFFELKLTNMEDYVFFAKRENEAKRTDGSSNPVIFLVKLK
ncbi:MAG: 6-bladed beta-propeller [Mangrovibacterium sp.]